jgi:DNA-binding XRE family transcriptional regulator
LRNGSRAASSLKESRKNLGKTQLQLSLDTFLSREAISKQENAEYKVQPELAHYFLEKHNNPWLAFEAAAEYVTWGPIKLDGDNVDLHRSSVKEKAIEEFEEMLEALKDINTVNHPKSLSTFELENIKRALIEIAEGMTAAMNLFSVLCDEYGISYQKIWQEHYQELRAKNYVRS